MNVERPDNLGASKPIPGQSVDPEADEIRILYNQFEDQIDNFFETDRDSDWVMIGLESSDIIASGKDSELPSISQLEELQERRGEKLEIFGRPVLIEPTSPDPNVPSAR